MSFQVVGVVGHTERFDVAKCETSRELDPSVCNSVAAPGGAKERIQVDSQSHRVLRQGLGMPNMGIDL